MIEKTAYGNMVTLTVTAEMIRGGKPGDWQTCPVGMAMAEIFRSFKGMAVTINHDMRQWAEAFDRGKTVSPTTFRTFIRPAPVAAGGTTKR